MEGLFHPQVRVELKDIVENMNRKIQAPDAHLGKRLVVLIDYLVY